MPTLTPAQTYAAARSAGFPPETARQMVAIAQRESSLRTGVVGTISPNETSIGLWQINVKDAGIRRLLEANGININNLTDPATNARAAYLLWGGNDANLNTAWYINRAGTQYGYAEKYQANLNRLPAAADFEMLYQGDGGVGAPGPGLGPGGIIPNPATNPNPATVTMTTPDGFTFIPAAVGALTGPGGGGDGGAGGGAGGGGIWDGTWAQPQQPPGGAGVDGADPAGPGGVSVGVWVGVAVVAVMVWWWWND